MGRYPRNLDPDKTYGLPGRRFPFLAEQEDDWLLLRDAIDEVVCGVDAMMYQAVRRLCDDLCDNDVDDLVQECRIFLMEKALPRFDSRNPHQCSLSTFLYRCIYNFLIQQLRHRTVKARRAQTMNFSDWATTAPAVKCMDPSFLTVSLHKWPK